MFELVRDLEVADEEQLIKLNRAKKKKSHVSYSEAPIKKLNNANLIR